MCGKLREKSSRGRATAETVKSDLAQASAADTVQVTEVTSVQGRGPPGMGLRGRPPAPGTCQRHADS